MSGSQEYCQGAAALSFYFLIYSFVASFGLWTLACNVAVAFGLTFRTLSRFSAIPVVFGILVGMLLAKHAGRQEARRRVSAESDEGSAYLPGPYLIFALMILAVLEIYKQYSVFWLLCVVFLAAVVFAMRKELRATNPSPPPMSGHGIIVLTLFAAVSVAITFLAHRPDADDSLYVAIAADALAHPDLPVLSHDPMYGIGRFALLMPTSKVSSVELFTALLAHRFGGSPLAWAHAVVPLVFAALLPFVWALFMRSTNRHWIAATALVMLLLVLLGESHGSLGNFAYVRLFQGKAVLASLGIPLLFALTWQFAKSGDVWDWVLLLLSSLTAVGFSSSSLFLVPMALGIAAAAAWRPGLTWRTVAGFLPALYPITCGIALRSSFSKIVPVLTFQMPSMEAAVSEVFGVHGKYVIFFGLLTAPLLARSARLGWQVAITALLMFLGPLNPWLFYGFARLASADAVWRMLWAAPLAGFAALALIGITEFAKLRWRLRGFLASVLAVVAVCVALMPYSSFRKSNRVSFSRQITKAPADTLDVARGAIAAAPVGTSVLAPEPVACWIPTFVHRPPLVSVRAVYDRQMSVQMSPEEASDRRELRELVSGERTTDVDRLLEILARYDVGVIVTSETTANALGARLSKRGYLELGVRHGYVLFTLANKQG